jgi:hypothetical protein
MRASALTKRHGWGVHYDAHGKMALYLMDQDGPVPDGFRSIPGVHPGWEGWPEAAARHAKQTGLIEDFKLFEHGDYTRRTCASVAGLETCSP